MSITWILLHLFGILYVPTSPYGSAPDVRAPDPIPAPPLRHTWPDNQPPPVYGPFPPRTVKLKEVPLSPKYGEAARPVKL